MRSAPAKPAPPHAGCAQRACPDLKALGQIDRDALQGVSRQQIRELASCRFSEWPEDVVIAGPIGTGKSHLAIALDVEAARRRSRVRFVKARIWCGCNCGCVG